MAKQPGVRGLMTDQVNDVLRSRIAKLEYAR